VPQGIDVRAVAQGVNALARFERHALSQPGITHIVVLEGINDIGTARQNPTPTAEDLIAGHKQLIEQAHTRGLKIFGATLTPFYGAAYYTEVGETKRQALNEWIRTGKAYDAVIDFDRVTRDPENPKMFLPLYVDAYENEPTCARFSEATECAGMIRCDAQIWGHPAKRTRALLGSTDASAIPQICPPASPSSSRSIVPA
jgi:hypothetical protein